MAADLIREYKPLMKRANDVGDEVWKKRAADLHEMLKSKPRDPLTREEVKGGGAAVMSC